MHTIAVYSHKGGAGKSSLTVFLAEFLASKYGGKNRVLVVDLDAQQSSSYTLLGEKLLFAALEKGKSVTKLMRNQLAGDNSPTTAIQFVQERSGFSGRSNIKYLETLHVLPSDREDWHDLNDHFYDVGKHDGDVYFPVLANALAPIKHHFDICLIDFPGHDQGPLIRSGIYAADWWLYPVQPDRMGARDPDSSRQLIKRVYLGEKKKIKGLGTVLNMCQIRSSKEYQKSRRSLERMAEQKLIPKLFSRDAEIAHSTDAKTALDELENHRTVSNMFGGTTKPLQKSVAKLCKEMLERLDKAHPTATAVDTEKNINPLVTENWR